MIRKKKLCICGCGVEGYIWSAGMLKGCFMKHKLPTEKEIKKKETTKLLHQFFLDLWDERADRQGNVYCAETGIYMSYTLFKENMACYHHLLHKSKYPELAFEKDNIAIIFPEVHSQVHSNIEKTPIVNKLTEKAKKKFLKNYE